MIPGSSTIVGQVVSTGFGLANSPPVVIFRGDGGAQLQPIDNYYANSVLTTIPPSTEIRVSAYTYLGNNEGKLTLTTSDNLLSGSTFTLSDPTDLALSKIFVPTSPSIANYYSGLIVYNETLDKTAKITNFDDTTGVIFTEQLVGWSPTDSLSIRTIQPSTIGTIVAGSTITTINVNGPIENAIGSFIRFQPTYPPVFPPLETRRIVGYTSGITNTLVVYPPLLNIPTIGSVFEILQWSYDTYNPLDSVITRQDEMKTHSIRLLNIVLPNKILKTNGGGTIGNQPYVYVTLNPINASGLFNTMSSNNPNARSMMFKAMRSFATTEAFVRFDGCGINKRIKFKSDGNYFFKVTLANGQLFETLEIDTISPFKPNPSIQISAIFEIECID
jgi:hypothetical protein